MLANNEIGTIRPGGDRAICREKNVLFHTDAVQGFGKIPFDFQAMQVDLASVSAHKIYGPKGVGALYARSRNPHVRLAPIVFGGGHERGMRSGTLNVPGIVGLGAAAELAVAEMAEEGKRLRTLRRRLYDGLRARIEDVSLNGARCRASNPTARFAVSGERLPAI
jgi:cysteine desulfurase